MTMQYVFGNHNFKWSRKWGFAVDFDHLRQRKQSSAYIRAYTNIARIAIESLTSSLYSNIPVWDVEAIDESATSGRRQKKITGKLLEGLYQTLMIDKDAGAAAFVFALFGQFAWESKWSPMAGRVVEIPRYEKKRQAAFSSYMAPNPPTAGLIETPTMIADTGGRPYLEDDWTIKRDGMGREIFDKVFSGNPDMGVLTPFEYRRGVGTIGMHKTRYAEVFRLMDYDEWLDTYGQVGGKTRFFNDVQPIYANSSVYQFALRFYMRMMYITPPSAEDMGQNAAGLGFGSSMLKHKVLVCEHFDEPHPTKWPEGRRVIMSNGACTHITKPQYNTNKRDGWHPLSEAQWMNCYPSSIASGPMQDLVKKNHEVNVLDSFIATAVRRNLGSQLLIKTGSGIDPERLTGEPGVAHEVTDPFGARWMHDEIPIPPVVASIRSMQMEDAYNQAGSLDAQRGENRDGAKSGYQAKIYEEREEKRLAPARKAFRNALANGGEKLLYALKTNVVKLDDSLMGYLISNAAGEYTPQDVISFMSKPLGVGTTIKIVENSMALKSTASQQALLQELAQGPLAQRLSQDAEVLDKYLKYFGAETLRDGSSAHRERAERENETFLDMIRLGFDMEGIVKPFVIFEDDDDIHINKHTDFIVKYWDVVRHNKAFLMEFYIHMETHRLQKDEKQAKLMPGTSLETGAMVNQAAMIPRPSIQTIAINSQMRKQQEAQQAQQAAPVNTPGAGTQQQGPQGPPGSPPGAKPVSPGAPASTTPAAAQNPPGAQPQAGA